VRYPSFARCMRAFSGHVRTAQFAAKQLAPTPAVGARQPGWRSVRGRARDQARARSLNLACAPRSAAVLGYALESFVDVWSSVLVLYRFWDDRVEPEAARQRERRASFGISLTVRTPSRALCPGVACPAGFP
jgi:hypothetical protein